MRLHRVALILSTVIILNVLPSARTGAYYRDLFCSDILGNIATVLECREQLDTLPDGIYIGRLTHADKPLTVVKRDSIIRHIGYTIFPAELRQSMPSSFYNVLERNALVKGLRIKRARTVEEEFAHQGVVFSKGKLQDLPDLYGQPDISFTLENRNGKVYHAKWTDTVNTICEIDMPYTYEFLNGTDMDENDRRLTDDLSMLARYHFAGDSTMAVDVDVESIVPYYITNYYVLPGKSYYFDGLNSNRYYEQDDSAMFRPVYSPEYPRESLANVCTATEVPNNLTVELKVIKYGFKTSNIEVPLTSMVDYFRRNGCEVFFGIIESGEKATLCEVIFRNTDEGYCHIVKMTVPADAIGTKDGKYTARLNGYIPISKIESLFDENK